MEVHVERLMTKAGGYTKADLARIGVPWPPPTGWSKKVKSGEWRLSEEQMAFLATRTRGVPQADHSKKEDRRAARRAKKLLKKARSPRRKMGRKPRVSSDYAKFVSSDEFLQSYEWRRVRYEALRINDGRCELCGSGKSDGVQLNVDHIRPRKKYPELALDLTNLQVLCGPCNHGKGNWDETDWR